MITSQMLSLMAATGYSPEDLGKVIGVSGMTLRRWVQKLPPAPVPAVYVSAIRDACYRLIAENRLDPELPVVKEILSEGSSNEYQAAIQNLGLRHGFKIDQTVPHDQILTCLLQIGSYTEKRITVDENPKKVFSFKKLGEEWSERITVLWKVVRSKKIASPDKVVAYGALFYLLTPIDFIPDHIPIFGLIDDFGVLGIAATYYTRKFGKRV
ncbi:MAG: YkvA family protein [Leptospirillum sp.]|uniref:Lfe123p4 n=1 Tax=Leptospirillum ferrooxidans TaxID=180 RepID=Q7X1J8_9BACT|nr:Lfe123p4 [Leptospirillum ferrooxidans]